MGREGWARAANGIGHGLPPVLGEHTEDNAPVNYVIRRTGMRFGFALQSDVIGGALTNDTVELCGWVCREQD